MDTTFDADTARRAALDALASWAVRRDRLPEDRADLLAAAWWSGTRNVAELARTADTSRDTVYADLRARGINPTDRLTTGTPHRPRYAPLRPETMRELAALAGQALLPSMLGETPTPLESAAWQMRTAYERIATLADPDSADQHTAAEDLADRLRTALHDAHTHWASLQTPAQLAARTVERDSLSLDYRAFTTKATITLCLPVGRTITVQLSQEDRPEPDAGWTTVHSESPLLNANLSSTDHLAIAAALDTIAEVLTAHLDGDAFETN